MSDGPEKSDVPPGRHTAEEDSEDSSQPANGDESEHATDDRAANSGLDSPDATDQREQTEPRVPSEEELFENTEQPATEQGQEQPAGEQEKPATEQGKHYGAQQQQEPKSVGEMSFDERVTAADDAIRKSKRGLDPEQILEYTTDRRSLAPHVQLEWGVWTSVYVVVLTLVFTFVLGNLGVDPRVGTLVLIVLFITGIIWVTLRYRKWVYQIRADAIYLERGVVTHRRSLVPYVRIQHVDTRRGVLERWLGLSTLVVYTAGSRGADVSIPGLEPDEARDLQQRVKELAIEAEGGDAL